MDNQLEDKLASLPWWIKEFLEDQDLLMDDDDAFDDFLVRGVRTNGMLVTYAMYLYAKRHNLRKIEFHNMLLDDGSPRPPSAQFLDELFAGQDISGLVLALDAGRMGHSFMGGDECNSEIG